MLRLTNTGKSHLVYGPVVGWTQPGDGGWVNVPNPVGGSGFPPGAELPGWAIAPGETKPASGMAWASLVPGIHRLTLLVSCASRNPDGSIRFDTATLATRPITVTPVAGL
jgi:hypothetical protein